MARGLRPPKDIADAVEIVRRFPTYARLVWGLLRDPRVPGRQKLILAAIAGYLILPVDLIPDFIPVLGQLDDIAIVLLGLDLFIRTAPEAVVEEHLARIAKDQDDLRRDLARAEGLLGDRFADLRATLDRIVPRDRGKGSA